MSKQAHYCFIEGPQYSRCTFLYSVSLLFEGFISITSTCKAYRRAKEVFIQEILHLFSVPENRSSAMNLLNLFTAIVKHFFHFQFGMPPGCSVQKGKHRSGVCRTCKSEVCHDCCSFRQKPHGCPSQTDVRPRPVAFPTKQTRHRCCSAQLFMSALFLSLLPFTLMFLLALLFPLMMFLLVLLQQFLLALVLFPLLSR